jgi:hypothetical protein
MGENDSLSNGSSSKFKKKSATQPRHHNIDYNKDLEYLLKDNAEECESLGILHRASFEKYSRLSNYINIPVIILSSAIGFATGIDIGYEKMNIILGIGSIFVGIIKSIDTYFQLGKRSESHRLCSLQYQQVHKKIQIELALKRPQRQTAKDMMAVIKTDIKNLQDISPLIDQDIIDTYNEKYGKYTAVKKPNFVNGLTEVIVNGTGDGDSCDVLHSRPRSEAGSLDGSDNDAGPDENGGGGGGGGGGRLAFPTLRNAVKIDAFGKGRLVPFQNETVMQPLQSSPLTAVANLVFKNGNGTGNGNGFGSDDVVVTGERLTNSLNTIYDMQQLPDIHDAQQSQQIQQQIQQLQQLHQLQQLQQLQHQFSAPPPPETSSGTPLNMPVSRRTPSSAPSPPLLTQTFAQPQQPLGQSQPQSRQLSARNSRAHTPNSEIIAITNNASNTHPVALNDAASDEQPPNTNNVVVTIIPHENVDDSNSAMM